MCAIAHGCATVQKSDYAKLAGVPVALLGMIGYVAILASARRATARPRAPRPRSSSIGGLGFSGWLTYVEVVELDAICIWCVGSAICMALLAGLTASRGCSSRLRRSPLARADHERGPGDEQQCERRDRRRRRRLPERERGDHRRAAAP